jgi:hypothetical protein
VAAVQLKKQKGRERFAFPALLLPGIFFFLEKKSFVAYNGGNALKGLWFHESHPAKSDEKVPQPQQKAARRRCRRK